MLYTKALLIAIVCLITIAFGKGAPRYFELSKDYAFEQYVQDFGKDHVLGSIEWFERKQNFDRELTRVLKHNADATQSYKMGVNQFTDMSTEERANFGRMFPTLHQEGKLPSMPPTETETAGKRSTPLKSARKAVDYRLSVPPVLTAVKDQGACGSCWSFATTESIESHTALQTGKLHVLSEQQLVGCAPNVTVTYYGQVAGKMGGCGGYFPNKAIDWLVSQGGGQTTEWMNPYTSYFYEWNPKAIKPVAKCDVAPRVFTKVDGYYKLPLNDPGVFETTLSDKGPVAIVMYVIDSFMSYEHGVYADPKCIGGSMSPSHAVLMMGYGRDEDLGLDYWIVRNSWATVWGEDGYFRILKESTAPACGTMPLPQASNSTNMVNQTACGTCGVLSYALYPLIAN